jgi:GT2 family glycosyltransferase
VNSSSVPVVLVHWNQPTACLRTIDRFLDEPEVCGIVVVDNGSTSDAVAAVAARAEELPTVELLDLATNTGFGPAANRGFQHWLSREGWEWIALAPHDALPEPGAIGAALEILGERPRAGLASADVGDQATPVIDPYFGGILAPASVSEGWEPADHPHGTLMFARRGCLTDVGLFDERYFAYCEEADLALRARARGWECGLLRGVMVENPHLSGTTAVVDYLQQRNTLLLVHEHSGAYHAFIRLMTGLIQLVRGTVRPGWRPLVWHPRARVRAMLDFLRGVTGPPPSDVYDEGLRS